MEANKYWYVAAGAVYSILEYWLGKTDKVKPGSAIDAALYGVKMLLKSIRRKEPK